MDSRGCIYSGLRNLPVELRRVMQGISDEYLPLDEGWSLRQTVQHMLDAIARIHLPRLEKIVETSNPFFADPETDDERAGRFDYGELLEEMVAELTGQCEQAADWLGTLSEEEWQRVGTHAILGTHPLHWWADRMLAHLEEHLSHIRGD